MAGIKQTVASPKNWYHLKRIFLQVCSTKWIGFYNAAITHFERKILQKTFGAQYDPITQEWHVRINNTLYQLYKDPTLTKEIRAQ